jgi:excisionase family DNA binding protein
MRVHAKPLSADDAIPLAHQPAQAAVRLGIGKTTLYELLDRKEIKSFKVGVRTLIPETELERFIQARLKATQ